MSRYCILEPEVAGELGDGCIMDTSVHPPVVTKLQYKFTGWLGDELLESFPCYIVTQRLGEALSKGGLTGFHLGAVEVVVSDEFCEMYPGCALPGFRWLRVTGQASVDDFGISGQYMLIVSDAALRILVKGTLSKCDVEEFAN